MTSREIEKVGEKIRKLRHERGLTQAELSKRTNISQAHIARIENGNVDPRISTVDQLTAALAEQQGILTVKDIMSTKISLVAPDITVAECARLLIENQISQMPVVAQNQVIGSITERDIIRSLTKEPTVDGKNVRDIMSDPFPIVSEGLSIQSVEQLLEEYQAVLVQQRGGKLTGILSRSDVLKNL